MKHLVLLLDGMADYPVPELSGKTPMELAKKPNIDFLAARGEVGLCKTVATKCSEECRRSNKSEYFYSPQTTMGSMFRCNNPQCSPIRKYAIGSQFRICCQRKKEEKI